MNYPIRKDRPYQAPKKHGNFKYPWDRMDIGDSFFVPSADDDVERIVRNLSAAGIKYSKRRSGQLIFSVRRTDGGATVWRIR